MLTTFASCSFEVDDVFDKNATERITEAIETDNNILVSAPNGWLIQYYGDTQYGGYNMLAKFNADSTVAVVNPIFGNSVYESHYKLDQSQGVILSFDSYNAAIHFFSDPANPAGVGTNGKGMLGDFEFRVLSASADRIEMEGKKHGSRVVMTAINENDSWDNVLSRLDDMDSKMFKQYYDLVVDGDTIRAYRNSNFNVISFTDENNIEYDMPYIVTDYGYSLYEDIDINGKTVSGFAYSKDKIFKATNDSSVSLIPYTPPITEQFVAGCWYISYNNLSSYGKKYFDVVKSGAIAMEETLSMMFGTKAISSSYGTAFGITFNSGGWWGQYVFDYTIIDKTHIKLEYTGTNVLNGDYYATYANYHYSTVPFGYYKQPKTFELTTDDLDDPSYVILQDVNDSTNVIKLSAKEIKDVFEN